MLILLTHRDANKDQTKQKLNIAVLTKTTYEVFKQTVYLNGGPNQSKPIVYYFDGTLHFIFKPTEFISETFDFISETFNFISETFDFISETFDFISEDL